MSKLLGWKQDHANVISRAEAIINAAASADRELTDAEARTIDGHMAQAAALDAKIKPIEAENTLRFGDAGLFGSASNARGRASKVLGAEYEASFYDYIASNGSKASAALYEGSAVAGGFAVPVEVNGQIVPLVPAETGIRAVAQVVPTSHDIRLPRQTAAGTVSGKAESGATVNTFAETSLALDSVLLSAFMAGAYSRISFELAQDVPYMQNFVVADLLNAQQQYEEGKYATGSGVGEAQGLIGNVGAGVTEEPDASGNLVTIDGTLDLTGMLNASYHANASWLMARPTGILIRKAQRQSNLFDPVFTSSNGRDYLHGYPVEYSAAMPAAARGATPILFGDFHEGYTIGERGGPGINVKVLDQTFALQGQVGILAYRRTDGRVRRPEAIQAYKIASS